jgi:hypothetical protein
MKKQLFSVLSFLMLCIGIQAQTILISPTGDGGFETGGTMAANGWTVVNGTTNTWNIGTATFASGAKSAYISNNGGTSYTFSNTTSAIAHFYRDVTIPAGESKIAFSFKLKGDGDVSAGTYYDKLMVYVAPTSFTPTTGAPASAGTALTGATLVYSQGANYGTAYVTIAGYLPAALAGTTVRLIFSWHNDGSFGTVPASVDDISLTSQVPGNFISIVTGNWTNPTTWDANAVPSPADNVTVTATHSVTIDANNQNANNLTIDGSLTYSSTPTAFNVFGNLLVNPTGNLMVFNGTTGKTLNLLGNFTNNGNVDLSKTGSLLNVVGSTAQTMGGSGTLVSDIIAGLTFNNSNSTPTINWNWSNKIVSGTLTFTKGWVNLGATNKLTLGTALTTGSNGTLSYTAGGFLNGTFSRWWTNAGTGSATSAGTNPTNATSRYPFINAAGLNRAAYIERVSPTAGGQYSVKYVDASTNSPVAITDGTYTVQSNYDGNWTVGVEGTTPAAASYNLVLLAQNAFAAANGNVRVTGLSAILGGTHRNGTTLPGAQRTGLTLAELTSGPAYIGASTADIIPPCTGAPNAGIAAASTSTICNATNFSLSLTGSTTGFTGITYQWQSSPDGIVWTNIAAATSTSAVVSLTATTYYQAVVTCTSSAMTSTSNIVMVNLNSFLNCYCTTSPSTGGAGDIVTNVSVTSSLGQNLSQASTSAAGYFVTYTNTPLDLVQGSTTNTVAITMGTDGTQYSAAWIDFNRNGVYEAAENIALAAASSPSNTTVTYTFAVPAGASLGLTRLRVRGGSDGAYTAGGACTTTGYGETEDYLVNIITQPTCFFVTSLLTANVTTMTTDLSWTAPVSGTPTAYKWEIRTSGAAGSGATGLAASGSVAATSTSVGVTGLTPLTSYSAYVQSDCGAGDLSSWSAVKTFTTMAACPVPTSLMISAVTPTTATATWTAGATETAWDVYYGIAPLTVPNAGTVPTATTSTNSYALTGLMPSSGYSVYVRANCGSGNTSIWAPLASFMTPCLPPNILSTTPSTRCGLGTLTLTATADPGAVINWYTAATGGTAIATGTTMTTPVISATTPYYAEAGNLFTVLESTGMPNITAASTTNSNYGDHGVVFATSKSNVTVKTSKLYINGNGTITISLRTSAGVEISNTGAINVTGSGSVTPIVVPINLTTTTPGSYQLILKSATGITNVYHETSPSYPYVAPSGNVGVTSGYWYGNDPAHRYFYDVNFEYMNLCASTRTLVTASVTSAPALTLNAPAAVCGGSGIATLSITSTTADYDSYIWSPATGLYTDAAATVPYTGGNASIVYVNTTAAGVANYNVAANNSTSGCAAVATTSISILEAPTSITITATPNPVCANSTFTLSGTANATPLVLLNENFNGATNNWTTLNASSGGTPAVSSWSLVPGNGIVWGSVTASSPDGSQMYVTNSDGQGTGGKTRTILTSPAINTINMTTLNLKFQQFYQYWASGDSAVIVQASTNGTTWTNIVDYKLGATSVGSATSFSNTTINLNGYINNPTLYVRFNYNATFGYGWAIDNVKVDGTSTNDYSYAWTSSPAGFTSSVSNPTTTATGTTDYSVVITNTTTTCSNNASVSVTVNPVPTVTASASSASVCPNTTVTLTATGATNYTWTAAGTSSTQVVSPAAASIYTVTGEMGGCSTTATVAVGVNSIPTVTATTSNTLVCSNFGESAVLTAVTAATTYTWSNGANTMTTTVTPAVATTYTLTVNDGICDATTTVFVDAQICAGINNVIASTAGINVYPNPTNGILNIAISSELAGATSIEVYDAIGKLVIKETLNSEITTINTTKLTDGMYMFKVINNNKAIKIGKIVKQ